MPEFLKILYLDLLEESAEQIENIVAEYGISERDIMQITLLSTDANTGRK